MGQGWRRYESRLEDGLVKDGVGMEQGWVKHGEGMGQGWSGDGSRMEKI